MSVIDQLRAALPADCSLGAPLAGGGQGAVFRGELGGEAVALKFFTAFEVERIKRELDVLSSIASPFIVRLIDFQILDVAGSAVPMVVYEFIEGGDLRAVATSGSALDHSTLVQAGEELGGAVETLWARRIVHRDIKPENVMRRADGGFVLVDLGLAQHLDLKTITGPLGQPGTNGYRSPEQCGGRRRMTIHSDVFSLGVTLFEVAAKRHPWNRNQALMGKAAPVPLGTVRPDIEPRVERLIHEMLSARAHQRPADPGRRFANIRGT